MPARALSGVPLGGWECDEDDDAATERAAAARPVRGRLLASLARPAQCLAASQCFAASLHAARALLAASRYTATSVAADVVAPSA